MGAIVVGDHHAPPAHPREGPVERGVVDIDLSPERRREGRKQFVDGVPGFPRIDASSGGKDIGMGLTEGGKRHHRAI